MATSTSAATALLPWWSNVRPCLYEKRRSSVFQCRRKPEKRCRCFVPVARLFGPSIFEASKLKVLFLGVDDEKHPAKLPRTYTFTHSDMTSKLTLAISNTINNSQLQGWYNKLQRDEVVAEWRKVKGKMSLHVHCHISGGHFLLHLLARVRFFIFTKELPLVLRAFVHGDGNLLNNHPELHGAPVWVYFHSNIPEFNKVQCWGALRDAVAPSCSAVPVNLGLPETCEEECRCCFPAESSIPWLREFPYVNDVGTKSRPQSFQKHTRET